MKSRTWRASAVAAACVTMLGLASLWAGQAAGGQTQQEPRGRIHGTVKDQTGGAIVGAAVTLTDPASGATRNVTTDESSEFSAPNLAPGTYTLRATFTGFQRYERTGITLQAGADLSTDVILQPGTCSGCAGIEVPVTRTVPLFEGGQIANEPALSLPMQRMGAQLAPLRILCSTAVHTPMMEMKAELERIAGRPVVIDWDSSQRLGAKIDAGEAFDVAILSIEGMDTYAGKGAVVMSSRTYLGRTGAAMAVRAGAPKPDISTREKLKQVLLNAKSIAMNPTGASGVHFNRLVAEMGIAEQMKPKMVFSSEPGSQNKNVAEGKAEMIWSQSTELSSYPGIVMIGPLPPDVQSYSMFELGVSARSAAREAAAAVVKYVASDPAAKAVFRAASVEVQ